MKKIQKILVANRGEIAVRVFKTAQKMGIKTVAVFSTADRNAPHVQLADEAICIGEAPSNSSYLLGDKIIAVAKELNVDAIHPGYGFLSENADFAQKVIDEGLIFIGPKPKAIQMMGDKLAAKEAVKNYDIPMVPGIDKAVTEVSVAIETAKQIGFPILIKAAAGGGGKGMRVVDKESDLEEQMERAISEAVSAFGNGAVFIEKYVNSPRHIEIQVLADTHGHIVHLFERECSIQRRHQKVVEEAPSSILTPQIRKEMGAAAVNVAKSCDYVGAGTVEFLMDADKNFYFLEMNTRLQVEHPVTEWITGLDLVEQQIRIAQGEALSFSQKDLSIKGHALELRVYAEDSLQHFMPSIGKLETYKLPVGDTIRVDNGFTEGMEVPIYYDPMLSKLITYGKNRDEAIAKMIEAIELYDIQGIQTTLAFGKFVCEHPAFKSGNFNTHFVKEYYAPEVLEEAYKNEALVAAKLALHLYLKDMNRIRMPQTQPKPAVQTLFNK